MSETTFTRTNRGRRWQIATFFFLLISISLLIALIVVATDKDSKDEQPTQRAQGPSVCGQGGSNPNGNTIDLSTPTNPGPFHDLTEEELKNLRQFLENDPQIQATPWSNFQGLPSSYIYMADLWLPPKADVLNFLDNGGQQPQRQARVMMFRGDKNPPVVEEWICGPLPEITKCEMLSYPNRRNPVEFEVRPMGLVEFFYLPYLVEALDGTVKDLLMESYGANVKDCPNSMDCLSLHPIAMGSALTDSLNKRYFWFWALYNVPFNLLHPTDFGVLLQASGVDPAGWTVEQVWYGGQMFDSLGDIAQQYATGTLNKTKMTKPVYSDDLFSTLHRRGDPLPPNPQRPPMQVEPDGKRYSVKGRKVDYQGWSFYFRLSSFQGPQLYDVQFHGDRIAYELGLSEIAVYYSGFSPFTQASDYIDSGVLSGLGTKALVPGGDCPETATLISYFVLNQHGPGVGKYDAAFCLFEHNNGYPLRRHLYYYKPDGFYSGMLDSVLTLRAALTVGNYDYIIDFIFHQNGALETRLMSTGYILGNMYKDVERLYGFQIEESLMGNLHHHMFHLKADLDVLGTSNRYETLNIERIDTHLSWNKSHPYTQSKFTSSLKQTEMEALYHFDFEHPKDHIVFNNAVRNRWGGQRAFRIHLSGMSKSLIPEDLSNEKAISWARNQIAVTKRKEEEFCSSSNYGMFDTLDPVVDFSTFYADDESIVDEDLVFWLTLGLHHIPHTEDLPVTPTAGNHLTAFILPYNYFPECPSMGSRDAIYIDYKDKADPTKGVKVERYGNSKEQCVIPRSDLEEKLEDNPDQVLESRRTLPTI